MSETTTSTRQTRPENGQAMNRVTHLLFGDGTVIESRTTESGQSVSLVRFDSSTVDRLILASSLKPSTVDSGEAPKAAPVKKTRRKNVKPAPVQEEVLDDKLFIELPDYTQQTAIHLDEVNIEEEPIEEAVTQDVQ